MHHVEHDHHFLAPLPRCRLCIVIRMLAKMHTRANTATPSVVPMMMSFSCLFEVVVAVVVVVGVGTKTGGELVAGREGEGKNADVTLVTGR